MRAFQIIVAVLAVLMSIGVLGMNLWLSSAYTTGVALPGCFKGLTIVSTLLVFVTAVTIFIRK
ncbi:MAG: hypothetical protein Q8876_10145 [Bacillota bacterium]|nr:hypothetical protein [Bacillota bacterium]